MFAARIALLLGSTAVALVLAELVLRLVPPRPKYETWFEDERHERVDYDAARTRGLVQPFTAGPRPTTLWAPGLRFFICYRRGARPYLDEHGCSEVRISHAHIRDERETPYAKPPGQQRVVCLGDSFTFGWGVNEPLTWVRRVETLRAAATQGDVRFVNCGASGTLYVDEYWTGLRDRFHRFEPDAVLLTICLNDIVFLSNPLGMSFRRPRPGPSRLWDALFAGGAARYEATVRWQLEAEPGRDWGQWLLDAVTGERAAAALRAQSVDPTCYWGSGMPQAALRAARDWCKQRGVQFGVVVWPLFQGLESEARYPFTTIHRVLREFCEAESLPVLDLLPHFLGQDPVRWWVDWSDQHANELAHEHAAGPIARFLAELPPARAK